MFGLIGGLLAVLMVGITEEAQVRLHRIRVRLYENHMAAIKGKFIARTVNEAVLTILEVCASLKDRGLYHGDTAELARLFMLVMHEAGHLLCDGFGINFHYFSIHPHVGGIFEKLLEGVSPDKHPVIFKFRVRAALRELAKLIEVYVEGAADSGAFIDEFTDITTGVDNEIATPNGMFSTTGVKIKIDGDKDKTGYFFKSRGVPSITTKVQGNFAENSPGKVIGMIPDLPPNNIWDSEIRTQYSGSSNLLKEVRVIKANFTLTT
jgi:hypothetical protein